MRRYRKKRGYRSRVVKMKFQSFVDLSTEADTMKIISVNAGGKDVIRRLSPFFSAYKYYKLGGVSIKLIPASTLPVDPLGLSYSLDDVDAVDPRDQLTPGMCRITNGEDILEDITGLTGDQQRQLYNNMLLDPRWYKWMLQTGVKRFGKPKYWQIGQLHQDKWPGTVLNYPLLDTDGSFTGCGSNRASMKVGVGFVQSGSGSAANGFSSKYGLFQTGHRGVLGWMPTDSLQPILTSSDGTLVEQALDAAVPEVELFKILMPPVRKTNYFYRMFITETVYFRDPIVMNVNTYRPIDVFTKTGLPLPQKPTDASTQNIWQDSVVEGVTGGNDGSN